MSVIALFIVASTVELDQAAKVLARADVRAVILAVAVMVGAVVLRIVIANVLIADTSDRRVQARRLIAPVLIGYLGNLVLPARLGELVRAYLITTREEIALATVLGAVALERIVDTAMLAMAAFVAAVALGADPWIVRGTGFLAGIGLLLVTLLTTAGVQPAVRFLRRRANVTLLAPLLTRIVHWLDQFAYSAGGSHRRRAISVAAAVSLLAWVCNAVVFWLAATAVGADLALAGVVLVMAVTVLSTAIPSAPGFVGTFELAAVAVAMSLGVASETALAFALLAHVIGVLPTAVGGAIALARLGMNLGAVTSAADAAAEDQ